MNVADELVEKFDLSDLESQGDDELLDTTADIIIAFDIFKKENNLRILENMSFGNIVLLEQLSNELKSRKLSTQTKIKGFFDFLYHQKDEKFNEPQVDNPDSEKG